MRSLISILLWVLFVPCFADTFSDKQYSTLINLAGRQRMLTQKMSKELLFIAHQLDIDKNKEALKQTSTLFEKTLEGLLTGSQELGLPVTTDREILKVLGESKIIWTDFKAIINAVLEGKAVDIAQVAKLNMPLLKSMNQAVQLYAQEAKKNTGFSAGNVIDLAGRQRMLSQKMSKEMLLIVLNHEATANSEELKKTVALFDQTLKGLLYGDEKLGLSATKEGKILAQLNQVSSIWGEFQKLTSDINQKTIDKMESLSLSLLQETNKVVQLYEETSK